MEQQRTMTIEEQEAARHVRLNEVGTMPPCPFCQRLRVERGDYIRCNPCGINWLQGTDWSRRPQYGLAKSTTVSPTPTAINGAALSASENK
jgi:ribosomal protein L37AE/L43A